MLPLIQGSEGVPAFTIDYEQYSSPSNPGVSLLERVRSAVLFPLSCVAAFALSLGRAAYLTLRNAPISFLRIIVGYRRTNAWDVPSGLQEVSSRIVRWILGLGLNIAQKTFEGVESRMHFHVGRLSQEEIGPDLDLRHLRMQHREISLTQVPQEVKIEQLLDLYREINFTEPERPGYMAPQTRQEGGKTHTVEELEKTLKQFIDHVRNRVPFIGTPPEFDIDGLERFYQQIENAVRFSIHIAQSRIEQFHKEHPGMQAESAYQNLLEDRARIAIDLAIAGSHCGARFMGESMDLYTYFNQGTQCVVMSLGDQLVELLSRTRLSIARVEAGVWLGSNVHGFSKYLQVMGPLLGLAGTANVIEHLMSTSTFNVERSVRSFFEHYTVPFIIEVVRKHYRTSSAFRDQVKDWIESSVGEWKRDEYERDIPKKVEQINALCKLPLEVPSEDIDTFDRMIAWFNANKKAKERSTDHYIMDAKRALVIPPRSCIFSQEGLGAQLFEEFETSLQTGTRQGDFRERCIQRLALIEKVRAVQKVMPELRSDTVERIIRGLVSTEEAVRATLHRERSQEFSGAILPMDADNTLSPELIEWMLVHHQIFLPQQKDSVPERIVSDFSTALTQKVVNQWNRLLPIAEMEMLSLPTVEESRYFVYQSLPQEELIADALFNRMFQVYPDEVIAGAERLGGRRFYPLWRRVCLIQCPETVSGILQSKISQVALFCIVSWKAYSWSRYYAREVIPQVLMHRVVPFVKERIPQATYQVIVPKLEQLSAWHLRAASHPLKYFMASSAVSRCAPLLPYPLLLLTRMALALGCMHLLMSPDSPHKRRWYLKGSESGFFTFLEEAMRWGSIVCEKVGVLGRLIGQFPAKERSYCRSLSKKEARCVWRALRALSENP